MANTPAIEPLLVRAKQAAAMCSVSPRTWATLAATGQVPESFKLGGCRVWRRSDIELWIQYGMPNCDRFEVMRQAQGKKTGKL